MITWPTWPSRGPPRFPRLRSDRSRDRDQPVSAMQPLCIQFLSDVVYAQMLSKCPYKFPKMCHGFPTDVPLSHAESPQMPRIELPATTKGSRKDYARLTQGATHHSRIEPVLSILPASLWQSIDFSISPQLLSTMSVSEKLRPWPPILYVWVTDMTRDPYHPTVGFGRTCRLPSGRGVEMC